MRPNPKDYILYAIGFVLWSILVYYTMVEPFTYLRN
jgi:hypothetical protein